MKQFTGNLLAQTVKQNAEAKLSSVDAILTLAEVSAVLNVSLDATKSLFDEGTIAGISLNRRHAVFLRSDLIKYLRETAGAQTKLRRELCSPSKPQEGDESRISPALRKNVTVRRGPRQRPLPVLPSLNDQFATLHS